MADDCFLDKTVRRIAMYLHNALSSIVFRPTVLLPRSGLCSLHKPDQSTSRGLRTSWPFLVENMGVNHRSRDPAAVALVGAADVMTAQGLAKAVEEVRFLLRGCGHQRGGRVSAQKGDRVLPSV